jgi:hypothetical protein
VISRRWLVATAVALVALALAAVAVTGRGDGDSEGSTTATTVISAQVVEDFLADFETSLTATFRTRSTFERRRGEDLVAGEDVTVVQRPPDRLTERDGSVSGRLDGRAVTCTGVGEDAECLAAAAAVDVAREVDEQLVTLRGYVTGDELLYGVAATDPLEVTRAGGEADRCYSLELLRQLPVAPYGTLARFCFDPETGAPTLLRVERPEAVDVTRAVEVSGRVTDEDLRLPG